MKLNNQVCANKECVLGIECRAFLKCKNQLFYLKQ